MKSCCICGKDVSRSKRTKDASGRYFCEECTHAEHRRRQAESSLSELEELVKRRYSPGRRSAPSSGSDPALDALIGLPQIDSDTSATSSVSLEGLARAYPPRRQRKAAARVPRRQPGRVLGALGAVVIFGSIYFGFELEGQRRTKEIEKQVRRDYPVSYTPSLSTEYKGVANDLTEQYEIARRNGNASDASVSAGAAAQAYLQAHDEANYKKWKNIEEIEQQKAVGNLPNFR